MFRQSHAWLALVLALSALALPILGQDVAPAASVSPVELILDLVGGVVETIRAAFGLETETARAPIDQTLKLSDPGGDEGGVLEIVPFTDTESSEESMPNYGPEAEPIG